MCKTQAASYRYGPALWGVTEEEEEAEQGKVLEIILDEVERSRPFFIGILGESYGSIPDDIPEDAKFAHPWLQDYLEYSLTALEIIHGVLRNQFLHLKIIRDVF